MAWWTYAVLGQIPLCLVGLAGGAVAIEVNPAQPQIHVALDRGKQVAAQHHSPETFHRRFGSEDPAQPNGFLLTKLGSLSVMATHMALRGLEPSAADIAYVIEAPTMLVRATIVGESSGFAVNSYMILEQEGKTIKPVMVRVDGQADHHAEWPESKKFQAKIVATFRYADFDPKARTTITIFPAIGGEVHFSLNFGDIE